MHFFSSPPLYFVANVTEYPLFRIGGRIQTVKFGAKESDIVELGANWIHGANEQNSAYSLVKELGMLPETPVLLNR